MKSFIQFFASWGIGDGIVGLITLVLSFAFSGSQKPFDWLFLVALLLSVTVWVLIYQLTIEITPKDKRQQESADQ